MERDVLDKFSDYLLWDVDRDAVDMERNAPFIVQRVLEVGQLNDWLLIVSYYGLSRIVEIATNLRTLDPKALSFVSAVSSTPIDSFRCCSQKQSDQAHWLY